MLKVVGQSQKPLCIWLMGLSGAGKTTLAQALKPQLDEQLGATVGLDGDELRSGLCSGLGFGRDARIENIRRCSEVAKLVLASGCNALVSCITPYEVQRQLVREALSDYELKFVYLSASLEVCEQRDPKGLYKRFREQGAYPLTGKGDPFESPDPSVLSIDTGNLSVDASVNRILAYCFS